MAAHGTRAALRFRADVASIAKEIIAHRRHIHKHPEVAFTEVKTAGYIAQHCRSLGLAVREGVGRTGVVVDIDGDSGPGQCIAFRADMDALPIQERTGLPFASENPGVMHACAHDGHVAQLLGVATLLAAQRATMRGRVRLLFQPAEEFEGGAVGMIEDGCLEGVDMVFGCHLWTYDECGVVGVRDGPVMASCDGLYVTINGKGGHGAAPQGTVDAIVAASYVVQGLQSVVSRNVDPLQAAVLTVGSIKGGTAPNVIADAVELAGTVRSLEPTVRETMHHRARTVCRCGAEAVGATADVRIVEENPATINAHPQCTAIVRHAAGRAVGGDWVGEPYLTMGAEDFCFYMHHRPGCFFFVGASPCPEGTSLAERLVAHPHHKPTFDIDERSLLVGTSVFMQIAEDLLMAPPGAAP